MYKKPEVPEEVLKKIDDIREWFKGTHHVGVEPYWAESEFGDEWKLRLIDTVTKEILVEHLQVAPADGHTFSMFIYAIREQRKKGRLEGLREAATRMGDNIFKLLGVSRDE